MGHQRWQLDTIFPVSAKQQRPDIPYKKFEKRTLFARKHQEGFLLGIERESNSREDKKTT